MGAVISQVAEDTERDARMLAQRIYMHEWARAQKATGLSLNTERAGIFADNINVDKEALHQQKNNCKRTRMLQGCVVIAQTNRKFEQRVESG